MTKPTGNPPGRPGRGITERMLLPLSLAMQDAVKLAAKAEGVAVTEWIRFAIEERLSRQKPPRSRPKAKKTKS